jgi:hypothetical protein
MDDRDDKEVMTAEIARLRGIIKRLVKAGTIEANGGYDGDYEMWCRDCGAYARYKGEGPDSHVVVEEHKPDCWIGAIEREFGAEDKG